MIKTDRPRLPVIHCETCGVRARVLVKLYSDISVILGVGGGAAALN